jgi:hypothetical protein
MGFPISKARLRCFDKIQQAAITSTLENKFTWLNTVIFCMCFNLLFDACAGFPDYLVIKEIATVNQRECLTLKNLPLQMWTNAVVEATYPQIENASVYSLIYIHRCLYNLEQGMYYLNGILVNFYI